MSESEDDLSRIEGIIRRRGAWAQYEDAVNGLGPRSAALAFMFLSGMSASAKLFSAQLAPIRESIETKGGRYPKGSSVWDRTVKELTSTPKDPSP